MSVSLIPVLGETFMRMRIRAVEKIIFQGGVFNPDELDAAFLEEVFVVGERRGHLAAFINLVRNAGSFTGAHDYYKDIEIPVLLIYGEKDWSKQHERERTISELPGANVETVSRAGHFLALEKPETIIKQIRDFSETL